MDVVLLACSFVLAVEHGRELFASDILESFRSTDIACVCIDKKERLDFRNSCYDPPDGDEFPELSPSDLANSNILIRLQWFEA